MEILTSVLLGNKIFTSGEEEALIKASESHPVNWAYLVQKGVISSLPSESKKVKKPKEPVETPVKMEAVPTPPKPKKVSTKNKPTSK